MSVPKHAAAFVHPYDREKTCAPKQGHFAVVRPGVRRAVLAHEVFHAFQNAYASKDPCLFYSEWEEATATWAGDWIYPRDDVEHDHRGALEQPELPVMFWGYGTWVFPRYLSERFGAKTIRAIEEAKETQGADDHIDKAIPGGLRARFPEFALYAWNDAPLPQVAGLGKSFRAWDRIAHTPKRKPVTRLQLGGARSVTERVPIARSLRILSREYRRIVVSDPDVRRVTFENPAADQPQFHVRAMVRRADGAWRAENWDGRRTVEFCRDEAAEDVQEIVLVYANSTTDNGKRVAATPRFVAEDSCGLRFKVLRASFSTHTVAAADDLLCGRQSGTIRFDGAGGEQAYDPEDELRRAFGTVDGRIDAEVPARWHGHHLEGCRFITEPKGQCVRDMPDRTPTPNGTWPVSLSVRGGWGDPEWELTWSLDRPEVGFFDAGDDECNVGIWGSFDLDVQKRRAPRETFLRTDPVTLTFDGSGTPSFISPREGASMTHTWSYALTIQRVDGNGRPLS